MKINALAILLSLSIGFLAFLPCAHAVSPAPDGGYPGFTTAEGTKALFSLTTGSANTAVGWYSLFSDTDGSFNTGVGAGTLVLNTGDENTGIGTAALLLNTASGNTAVGSRALLNNTTGGTLTNIQGLDVGPNVAIGQQALENNTLASANTAVGYQALQSFTTGPAGLEQAGLCTAVGFQALAHTIGLGNSALGYHALFNNTAGLSNTAAGQLALSGNTAGNSNTAVGSGALVANTIGSDNTAIGFVTLSANITGSSNAALGYGALDNNIDGNSNTATGAFALQDNTTGANNTAVGDGALLHNTTGNQNVALGFAAGEDATTGDYNVYIGASMLGVAAETNHTYIRNINTTSVSGGGTDTVTINLTTGLLGHLSSSRRYKDDIKPMDRASEALYLLKPVSYRYKKEIDSTQSPAFGLIAEEVADVNSALVACNSEGQPESVHYEMVNAMLLNEFLKEHRKNDEQQKQIDVLTAQLKEQAAQIQRVSAQLEANRPAPGVVNNN
jgi:hypothetical protein